MMLGDIKEFELVGYSAEVNGAIISIGAMHPDVVILDLEMKQESGIRVLEAVKQKFPEIIFIIATNSSNAQYRIRCEALGAEYFFDKSKEFEQIPKTVIELETRPRRTRGKITG